MEKADQQIVQFLSEISGYYYHENDLSNITVALCNSCVVFRDIFVRFFFRDIDVDSILSVVREVPDNNCAGCRVDVMIETTNGRYLIEVKINDRHQHFDEYPKAYEIPANHLGYIVNYEYSQRGFDVKRWIDFYRHLKRENDKIDDEVGHSLICGYLEYMSRVCSIVDFSEPMKFENISGIHQFFAIASAKLTIEAENYSVIARKITNPTSGIRMAPFTNLSFDIVFKRRKTITGYVYLYHGLGYDPAVYIAIPVDANSRIVAAIKDGIAIRGGKAFLKPVTGNDDWYVNMEFLWFQMKTFDKMVQSVSSEEQENLIGDYINEVVAAVAGI